MNRFINNLPPLLRRRKNKDSDATYAIIKALEEVLIQTEDDIVASKIHSFLHSAKGWGLDEWGSWFNLSRKEKETDEQFRKRIIDKIKIPRGTNAAIKWGIRDYLDDFDLPINITETWTKVFINNKHGLNSDYYLIGKKYNIALFEVRILKDIKEIADKYFSGDEALAKYELLKVINEYKSSGTHATLVFGKARETGTNESIEDIIKEEIKDKDPARPEEIKLKLHVKVVNTWDNIFYTNRSKLNGGNVFIGAKNNARVIQVLIGETLEYIAETPEIIEYPSELVGGRNLLTGTSESEQELKALNASIGSWNPSLTIGEEYTFSFDIKSENATYLQNVFLNNSNKGFIPNTPISKEWTRIHFTFKWKGGTYYNNEFAPHVYPRPAYLGTYVSRVKLEKGTKATPWTPAPEDLGYDFPSEITSFNPGLSSGGGLQNLFKGNKELADAAIKKIVYQTKPENTIPHIIYGVSSLIED